MGIPIEFNPDLALREFGTPNRHPAECLPQANHLLEGMIHSFRKKGQRVYWLEGEIPLLTTKGNQKLSPPIAAIVIEKYQTSKERGGEIWTTGLYRIVEVFDSKDKKAHFNGFQYLPPKRRGKK